MPGEIPNLPTQKLHECTSIFEIKPAMPYKDSLVDVITHSSITFLPHSTAKQITSRISAFQSQLRTKISRAKDTERKEIFTALANAVAKVGIEGNPPNASCSKLWTRLVRIKELATTNPTDIRKCNHEILTLMRQALTTKYYEQNKENESDPAIKMIHGLCLASYAEPKVLHAFHEIGASLHGKLPEEQQQASFHERIKHFRDTGYRHGLIKKIFSLEYIFAYFTSLFNSMSSSWIIGKLAGLLRAPYDPRGHENNAGVLYEESIKADEGQIVEMRTVYTPSPTVGNQVSPEAKGILQAMKNRKKMSKNELENDPYPYVMWHYVNLQAIDSLDEGRRSQAIMKLHEEFPGVFYGITLAQDSSFYRASIDGENERKIEAAIYDPEPLSSMYANKQLQELEHEANYSLIRRGKHPRGYFFPVAEKERESWKKACRELVEHAFKTVCSQQKPKSLKKEGWNWYQKAAFRELVLLGVIKLWQCRAAKEVAPTGGKILATNACKENIDRGGKTNACMLWALGGSEEDVLSALHARALLAEKSRLILPNRLEPMYALALVVPQQQAMLFMQNLPCF